MKPERWRLFVAVPVADDVKTAIAKFSGGLAEPYRFQAAQPRFLHLTVRFFGDVPADEVPALAAKLAAACHRSAPFKLCAEGLGHFDHRVLWVALHGNVAALHRLVTEVTVETSMFGEHVEKRVFTPHITIGKRSPCYSRSGDLAKLLEQHRSAAFGEWRVDHLELIRSVPAPSGAAHTMLARLPLGRTAH